jgi:hypothetical protein
MWFHSQLNPYNPFEQLKKILAGKKPYETRIRAYGWADNVSGNQFPRFTDANIIPAKDVPKDGTNYMVCDPAGARNWFMLWLRVTETGEMYVYREWPDMSEGEWAMPDSSPDGRAGSAQRNNCARSIEDYKSLIREMEGDEEICERFIDPRAGGSKASMDEGGISLIEMLDGGDEPMHFRPAAGIRIEQGVAMINDGFAYDHNLPLNSLNHPKLYVSEDCQNLIYCLREWTGKDGDKGATKDPVDCLRYLMVMDPEYQGRNAMRSWGGGSY